MKNLFFPENFYKVVNLNLTGPSSHSFSLQISAFIHWAAVLDEKCVFVHHPLEKKKSVDGASFNRTFLDVDRIIYMCISVFLYLIKINLSQNSNVSGFTFFRLQISSKEFFLCMWHAVHRQKIKRKKKSKQNKTKAKHCKNTRLWS